MQHLGRNKAVVASPEHDIVVAEANSAVPLKGDFERMARRRFQRGQLVLRGKRSPVWVGRYREDIIRDGKIQRLEKWVILARLTIACCSTATKSKTPQPRSSASEASAPPAG